MKTIIIKSNAVNTFFTYFDSHNLHFDNIKVTVWHFELGDTVIELEYNNIDNYEKDLEYIKVMYDDCIIE